MNMSVKLENKQTSIALGPEEGAKKLDYLTMLSGVIGRQAVNTAWTLDELKTRLSVIDLLEQNTDAEFIEINDKQKELIKTEVAGSRWTVAHIDIVNFVEYIESL